MSLMQIAAKFLLIQSEHTNKIFQKSRIQEIFSENFLNKFRCCRYYLNYFYFKFKLSKDAQVGITYWQYSFQYGKLSNLTGVEPVLNPIPGQCSHTPCLAL
jgi:hypothetical protein